MVSNPAQLEAWLREKGIDTTGWGKGGAKQIADLWAELVEGDSSIQGTAPYRQVSVVQLIITRGDLVLVEAEQEFGNGQKRSRERPPSEKLKPNEGYSEGALRCAREELGLEAHHVTLLDDTHRLTEELSDSTSYPGLMTQYRFHTIKATVRGLPSSDFWLPNKSYDEFGDPVIRHRWVWRPIESLPQGFQQKRPD